MSKKLFLIYGLVGMLLDLDHMIPVLKNGIPLSKAWAYMTVQGVRDFHILGVWLSFMIFAYCWANEDSQ